MSTWNPISTPSTRCSSPEEELSSRYQLNPHLTLPSLFSFFQLHPDHVMSCRPLPSSKPYPYPNPYLIMPCHVAGHLHSKRALRGLLQLWRLYQRAYLPRRSLTLYQRVCGCMQGQQLGPRHASPSLPSRHHRPPHPPPIVFPPSSSPRPLLSAPTHLPSPISLPLVLHLYMLISII